MLVELINKTIQDSPKTSEPLSPTIIEHFYSFILINSSQVPIALHGLKTTALYFTVKKTQYQPYFY